MTIEQLARRVVERGSHEALLRSGGEYARLWSMQQADEGAPDADVDGVRSRQTVLPATDRREPGATPISAQA